MAGRRILKPVFVPKQARETIAEREALEKEEEELAEKEKLRLTERKYETQHLVREAISLELAAAQETHQMGLLNVEDVNTDDDDPEQALEVWKQRELLRLRRDKEEDAKQEKEILERERLRNMTDAEREAWERANPKEQANHEKSKLKFMQKYWHKGAYFQEAPDDERSSAGGRTGGGPQDGLPPLTVALSSGGYEIFKRDFSAPTGEDKFNKESMPKVMQVKNFGRSGRTKYTHLVDQDTTFNSGAGLDESILQVGEL